MVADSTYFPFKMCRFWRLEFNFRLVVNSGFGRKKGFKMYVLNIQSISFFKFYFLFVYFNALLDC